MIGNKAVTNPFPTGPSLSNHFMVFLTASVTLSQFCINKIRPTTRAPIPVAINASLNNFIAVVDAVVAVARPTFAPACAVVAAVFANAGAMDPVKIKFLAFSRPFLI